MIRHLSRRGFRRLSDAKGANLVEAAIITPMLLLLTFAIVDFATLFYVWLSLQNGASQATRYAVTGNTAAGMNREESIKWAMRQATPTITIPDGAFSFSHMPPNSTAWVGGIGGPDDVGKVTVTYSWTPFTPLIAPLFNNAPLSISVESAMKNEKIFSAQP